MKFAIKGTEYNPRKLTVQDIRTLQENYVEHLMEDAAKFAAKLAGTEKREFLLDSWKGIPTGDDLSEGTSRWLQSVSGVITVLNLTCDKEVQITDLNDVEEYLPIVDYVFGRVGGKGESQIPLTPVK